MKLLAAFFLALLTVVNGNAQGLIWSVSRTETGGGVEGGGPLGNREIALDHVSNPLYPILPSLNPVSGIFSMSISTNDAGHTFFANTVNAPGFAGFAAGITDGANDYIRISEYSSSFYGYLNEADFLGRSPAAPDFAGYTITQIDFRVDNYYDWFYAPENRYLNTLDYSLVFYGSPVPEPSTWALLGLGGATALLLRRKARRPR